MKASFPNSINVEIELSAFCQLKCPFCRTGGLRQQYQHIKRGFMKVDTMKVIMDKIFDKTRIGFAYLYNWGEPLLNPDVVELVETVTRKSAPCELGTNLQHLTPEMASGIAKSGLGSIRVSCDGMIQETYETYRRGGNLQLLLSNSRMLADAKKQNSHHGPQIIFQMIVTKFNHHEIPQYEAFAKQNGADSVIFSPLCALTPEGWLQHKDFVHSDKYSLLCVGNIKDCRSPWNRLSFDWNGDVYNCCNPVGLEHYCLGNILESSLEDIWNCEKMQYIRRYCSTKKAEVETPDIPCYRCFGIFPSEERKKNDEYYPCFVELEKK